MEKDEEKQAEEPVETEKSTEVDALIKEPGEKAVEKAEDEAKNEEESPKGTSFSEAAKPKESSWDLEEEASSLGKKNKNFFKPGIIILVIILIVTGVLFFFLFNSNSKKAPIETKKTTIEPTKAPEKTEINRSEWTLEVLNGSGVVGVAAKAAAKLTEQGYTVIKTGNANNQDYKKSELFVSENMQSKAQLIIDDLKSDYGFSSVSGILSNSTASARIILGAE